MSSRQDNISSTLQVKVLGTFTVSVNNRRVNDSAWKLRKAKAVLKLLAIAPDHRLPRDKVLDTLWPELDPQAALNNLHKALLVARRALEPDSSGAGNYISFRNDTLGLDAPAGLEVDAVRFPWPCIRVSDCPNHQAIRNRDRRGPRESDTGPRESDSK